MTRPDPVVRDARQRDAGDVEELAAEVAVSFALDATAFTTSFAAALTAPGVHLLVAEVDGRAGGYLLAVEHPTFFANGPVAWIEELGVRVDLRRQGLAALLVRALEDRVRPRCALVALATTRAGAFYRTVGYERRAEYFRKVL